MREVEETAEGGEGGGQETTEIGAVASGEPMMGDGGPALPAAAVAGSAAFFAADLSVGATLTHFVGFRSMNFGLARYAGMIEGRWWL